jgi:hypothetical protein
MRPDRLDWFGVMLFYTHGQRPNVSSVIMEDAPLLMLKILPRAPADDVAR